MGTLPTPALPTVEELEAGTSTTCAADEFLIGLEGCLKYFQESEGEIEGLSNEFFGALWTVTTYGREDLKRAMDYLESIEVRAERLLWRFAEQEVNARVEAGRGEVA